MFDTIYCLFVSLFALWIGFQACITVMQTNPRHTGHNEVIQKKMSSGKTDNVIVISNIWSFSTLSLTCLPNVFIISQGSKHKPNI